MDNVLGFISNNSILLLGGGVTGIVAWVLKKVPNEQISNIIETFFYGLGKTMTLGLSKWSVSKKYWNQIIEPWFVDLVDNIFGSAVNGFIKGLRMDNK